MHYNYTPLPTILDSESSTMNKTTEMKLPVFRFEDVEWKYLLLLGGEEIGESVGYI